MKHLASLLLLLGALACIPSARAQAPDWNKIPIPPLPAFHPQEPKRIELPNGMVIFLQEDHELPLIEGTARIRGGSRSEPTAKVGMVDMYGEVWRTGGTTVQTGDALDDFLEARAAKVETSNSSDSTSISLSCLKGDFDDVFKVFKDLLLHPEFRADKLDLARKEFQDAISRRNDDASEIAERESAKLAYGKDNPYARSAEYSTVDAVSREDLVAWHDQHVYPNYIILGMVGDFDSAAMESRLRAAFGDWAKGPDWKPDPIELNPAKPGYYLIPKDDVNQSSIRMVELGMKRDDPDYFAAQVFNEAFGGGFASRLFKSIRTAQGLAYNVGGGIGSSFDHLGVVRFTLGTKSASTTQAIQALYKEIDDLDAHPITAEEIKHAKDSILNSFVFRFDSPDKVLQERMAYEFYGYPPDFLERFRTAIETTKPEDVARVAKKYVHRDQLAVLVVGNTGEFDKPLGSLGAVMNIDIAIPPPPGSAADVPSPTVSNAEGKALALKVAEGMGGLAKLQTVHSVHTVFSSADPDGGRQTPIDAVLVFPDKLHVNLQTPNGAVTIVVTPDAGFMSAANTGARDLPSSSKQEMGEQVRRDLIFLAQHADDSSFIFAADGTEKIGALDTKIVDVSGAGITMRWYVDPASGHVVREDYTALTQAGPVPSQTDLSDWKTTDGITLPAVHNNFQGGQETSIVTFSSWQFNPPLDAALFQKPASAPPAK